MENTDNFQNTLYTCDNLFVLNGMNSETVDLIYLDPPFNSKRTYSAPIGSKAAGASFKDMWTWEDVDEEYLFTLVEYYPTLVEFIKSIQETHSKAMMAYVAYMAQRIIEMHRILKETGSFYLHCDPTASHYLKILLDTVFGRENFRNEIVWCYNTGGKPKDSYAKKHDSIFFYTKSKKWSFNSKNISIAMTPHKSSSNSNNYGGKMGIDENGREYVDKQGSKDKNGNYKYYRYYLDEGKIPEDWWIDINSIQSGAHERIGYPTQKPEALLERIIKASSNEGDVVLDAFVGGGTTIAVANKLNRKWIGIDQSVQAIELTKKRLKI